MEWNTQGNVFIRPIAMKKGDVVYGHTHRFDHVSIILRGSVRMKAKFPDGREVVQEFYSPTSDSGMDRCHVLIKAEVSHEIEALEDNTVFWCVYAHRTPQGDVVQEYTGWTLAYS